LDTYYKYILSEKNLAKILSPYDSAVYYPANGDAITYVFHVDESMPIKEAYWLIGNERIDLSQSASVKVINGETERYLVIRQPVQDIFKIIAQGGLVKGHSIVVVT
ncbi:MAG: hypothetical protein NT129_01520, partial [Candidatus Aenigmarchaeota archaeon]|nr:hypothetical protein [Candidatus Aenigmarchaeota archaeon]